MAEKSVNAHFWFMERRSFFLLIIVAFVTLSAITFLICYRHHAVSTQQALKEDRAIATLLSAVLDERIKKIFSVMESYAQRTPLIQAANDKNAEKARYHLIDLVKNNPDIDFVIISDREGTPWAASYPGASPVIGKNFAHRDWYKGVSKEWKPYITDVILRVIEEKDLAVQISVPCFNEKGEVVGILVNTQRTVGFNNLFKQALLDPGTSITVTDSKGQIVYTTRYGVGKEIRPYPFHPVMKKAIAGKNNTFTVDDPDLDGGTLYISFAPVAHIGWTVFVERGKRSIFLLEGTYYIQVTAIAFLLFISISLFLIYSRKQVMTNQLVAKLQAEKIIRAGEEKLRFLSSRQDAILAAVPEIIMEVDKNKVYTWANSAGTEFFGEDVIGKEAAFYFEGEQETYERVSPLFSGSEEIIYVESWQRRGDGEKRLLAWWCRVLKDAEGNASGALSSARDITERNQMEEALRKSEIQLRAVLDATPFPIALVDVQDNGIDYWSQSAVTLFGHTAPTAPEWYQMAYPDPDYQSEVIDRWKPYLEIARASGKPVNTGEYRVTCRNGSVRICELYATFVTDRLVVTFNDITERKRVEESLRESEKNYQNLFDNAIEAIFVAQDGKLVFINPMTAGMLGYSGEDLMSRSFVEFIHPDDRGMVIDRHVRRLKGEEFPQTYSFRVIPADGNVIWVELKTVVVKWKGKPATLNFLSDITDWKRIQEETAILAEIGRVIGSTLDIDEVYERFAVEARKLIPSDRVTVSLSNPDGKSFTIAYLSGFDVPERRHGAIISTEGSVGEIFMHRKSGLIINMESLEDLIRQFPSVNSRSVILTEVRSIIGVPLVYRNEVIGSLQFRSKTSNAYTGRDLSLAERIGNQIAGAIGSAQLFSNLKLVGEQIKASLLEKETMLKEIHHRVKNNLQVISSLLDMQSSHVNDEKAREALENSMFRVRTMAMIHAQLYQSQDLARIDFDQFVRDLVGNISQSYRRTGSPVEIRVDVEEIHIGIDSSIPCGLILNELIANALEHAFPEGRPEEKEGRIDVAMRLEDNRMVLTVSDNGIGFPEPVDLTNIKSLGLELVHILVGQINGKIDMRGDGGTTWTITFPLKKDREWKNG